VSLYKRDNSITPRFGYDQGVFGGKYEKPAKTGLCLIAKGLVTNTDFLNTFGQPKGSYLGIIGKSTVNQNQDFTD